MFIYFKKFSLKVSILFIFNLFQIRTFDEIDDKNEFIQFDTIKLLIFKNPNTLF